MALKISLLTNPVTGFSIREKDQLSSTQSSPSLRTALTLPIPDREHVSYGSEIGAKLPCVMMILVVTHATSQKGKVGAHHKRNSDDGDPKYFNLGDLEQRIKQAPDSIRAIYNNSISPWEIIYTTDPNRIPSQLPEARCLLSGCLNWKGEETLELESRRILMQVPVLHRVRHGGDKNYYFRLEHKAISVGCTCVRPYVEQV